MTFAGFDAKSDALLVGGYVDVVRQGGTCTATATSGAVTVSATSPATPDATTTSCGTVSVPGDRLTAGTWHTTLTYEFSGASVTGPAVDVEVAR